MKVWKDADEVIKMVHELDSEKLRQLDREMQKKPNFDKSKKGENECFKNEKNKKTFKTHKRY